MNVAEMRQELQLQEQRRRAAQLPLFYGMKAKDTVTAKVLLDRIVRAAAIANWDDARKLNEFYMILRERALVWWDSLADSDVDTANWNAVKAAFLATYEPKFTAKTNCTNFQELVQRSGEGCHDYFLRVHESFAKMCEAKPDTISDVRSAELPAGAIPAANVTDDQRKALKNEGIKDIEKFFKHQLFIAGLKEDIRAKVMEAGHENLADSVKLAVELEIIQQDRRSRVSAVSQSSSENVGVNAVGHSNMDDPLDDMGDEELAAVNAIRVRLGRPPFQRRFGFNRGNGKPLRDKKSIICHYCKKPGHFQRECNSRKAANAPMVPPPKRVNALNEGNASNATAVNAVNAANAVDAVNVGSHNVGAISAAAINHLNW